MENDNLLSLLYDTSQGDKHAFSTLYQQTSGKLFAISLNMLSNRAHAEEVLQDAFIKIWHNAGNYQRGKGTVLTWMVSIARYRALDLIRYHNVRNEVELNDDAPSGVESSQNIKLGAEQARLAACLDELDGPQRQAIHLAYVNGMSHQEVVSHLASPLGTIKSWIRRGLQSLQRCLSL